MKKIFLSLLTIFLVSCGSTAQEGEQIGINQDGRYVITMDEDIIKEKFENILRRQDNDAVLTEFKIISDENDEGTYYMLVGYNGNNSVKIATKLNLVQNRLFYGGFTNTVTCSGCTSGCSPYGDADGWHCKPPSCGDCSKSETVEY